MTICYNIMQTIYLQDDVKIETDLIPSVISHFARRYNIDKSEKKCSREDL